MNNKSPLILASASPRRKELLKQIGLEFKVFPSHIDEYIDNNLPIEGQVEKLAVDKAKEVFSHFPDSIILGADTVVVLDDKIIGKPENTLNAIQMLKKLRGKEHMVITGVAVLRSGKKAVGHKKTYVSIKEVTDSVITKYVESGEPMDKAGAYAIQGLGALLVEGIIGDFSNVVGLPLGLTASLLSELGFNVS